MSTLFSTIQTEIYYIDSCESIKLMFFTFHTLASSILSQVNVYNSTIDNRLCTTRANLFLHLLCLFREHKQITFHANTHFLHHDRLLQPLFCSPCVPGRHNWPAGRSVFGSIHMFILVVQNQPVNILWLLIIIQLVPSMIIHFQIVYQSINQSIQHSKTKKGTTGY